MNYVPFDQAKPDATDNGVVVLQTIRENFAAMRDALFMGNIAGWSVSAYGNDLSEPDGFVATKGVEIIRSMLTYINSGVSSGNVSIAVYDYSLDSGTNYSPIQTKTYSYDVNGDFQTMVVS